MSTYRFQRLIRAVQIGAVLMNIYITVLMPTTVHAIMVIVVLGAYAVSGWMHIKNWEKAEREGKDWEEGLNGNSIH